MLSGGASTKRQPTISTSSTEAEYIGQFNAAREATWIRLFLEKLGNGYDNLCRQQWSTSSYDTIIVGGYLQGDLCKINEKWECIQWLKK